MKDNLLDIISEVSKEKGLDREIVTQVLEESLVEAARRKLPYEAIEGRIHPKTGQIELFHFKEVVEVVEDRYNEIALEEAQEMDPEAQPGDEVECEIPERELERIARSARQFIFSNIRDAEREMVVETFSKRKGEIITGTVLRTESNGRIAINFLNRSEAYLFRREQIPGERFSQGDHIRVLLLDVNNNPQKASQLTISRTHPMLLVKLFEMEVPEIFDGVVEVIHAAREPGRRAKISVFTNDDDVDPVGACVGLRGARVQAIVNELHGEKVDIVRWSDDIETYARNALAPAEVENMTILSGTREIHVKVDPSQLSLAIGRQGVNVRLASKLVGYKINVTTTDPQETLSIEEQLRQQLGEASREREAQEALEAAEAEALQSEETPEKQESDATDIPEAVEATEDTEAAEPEADSTDPEPSAEVDESSSESAGPEESKAVSAD